MRPEPAKGVLVRILALLFAILAASAGLPGSLRGWPAHAAGGSITAEETRFNRLVIETGRGPVPFRVELAATPEMLVQGLQHRRQLAADAGMLFDFGPERIVTMWMKNTYIPLDMLFIDAGGQVADIAEHTKPLSLNTIASRVPVRAVLEVNAGTVGRLGIRTGDRIDHPMFALR